MSAAETCPGFWIGGRTLSKDAGAVSKAGPVGNLEPSLAIKGGWQAQLTRITQSSARANGAVAGSSPGHSGFKVGRLMYSCW